MPDLLTHVLVAYSVCLVLSWRVEWLRPSYVTAAMFGAMLPDLSKVHHLVSSWQVRRLFGVPFSWMSLHTTGGVAVSVLLVTVVVARPYRRRVGLLLALGAVTHLVADSLLWSVSGRPFPLLWPLTAYVPPTPDLYLSTDPWLAVVSGSIAAGLTAVTRYRERQPTDRSPEGDG